MLEFDFLKRLGIEKNIDTIDCQKSYSFNGIPLALRAEDRYQPLISLFLLKKLFHAIAQFS